MVGEPPGPVEERRPLPGIVGQVRRLCEVALRLTGGGEGLGPIAGADERRPRFRADVRSVGRLGVGLVGVDVVRRDHLGDLVLFRERCAQVFGRREVARPPLVSRERLVRHVADEVLQEAVLAVLGRADVCLQAENLLPDQRGEQGFELLGREP